MADSQQNEKCMLEVYYNNGLKFRWATPIQSEMKKENSLGKLPLLVGLSPGTVE